MFYGREKELSDLNKRYNGNNFEFVVFSGRRRVGKTFLINKFCENKPTIFFSAIIDNLKGNLQALSKEIYRFTNPDETVFPVYSTIDEAFEKITSLAEKQRLIFVIDEYPYLAKADKSVSSKLQHIIDKFWQNSKLFFILCGSSISFMENKVLSSKSPLFGRRTGQYKIQPLSYREITAFHPKLKIEEQALLYGITGGVPHYINQLRIKDNLYDALKDNFFSPSSYLYDEPNNLLKQEFREPTKYNAIITAIADGASHLNEIATRVGSESGQCTKYIKQLISLGIIKKELPIKEKSVKKTIYLISDNFFRFWFKFVPKNASIIESGRFSDLFDIAVKRYLSEYMGLVFEDMCKEYLLKYEKDLPIPISAVGQWWGSDVKSKKEVQIDIVGKPIDGKEYIIGSCKYTNEPVGIDELNLLKEYSAAFNKGSKYHYYIFSKSGFTKGLTDYAKTNDIRLVSLKDLY